MRYYSPFYYTNVLFFARCIFILCLSLFAQCRAGIHNLFVIASHIMFIFMNYGRQSVQDIFIFCISSVLLQHTNPSLLPHVCLAVFLQSIIIQQKNSFNECTASFN